MRYTFLSNLVTNLKVKLFLDLITVLELQSVGHEKPLQNLPAAPHRGLGWETTPLAQFFMLWLLVYPLCSPHTPPAWKL